MVNQEHLRILVSADVKELNAGLNTASTRLKGFGNKLTGIGKNLSTRLTLPIALAGGAAIKMASDFNESLNKVEVAFGKSSNFVKEFANTTITQFGIAEGSALDMAALFGDMATSMGLTTNQASIMSTQLVGLAGDLASFKNINIEQATTALAGVFTGETESLKRLGIVMTIANLELFAMSKGIQKQIKDMTQAEKVTLRYQYIMEKTANAQGDFNRTQSGSANQIRIFQESLKELGVSFGKIILPLFTKLVVKANNIINSFKNLSPKLKEGILRFGALAAILPPLLIVLGSIATAIGAISAPVAIAIAAVSALVIFFDDIVEAGENLRNFLQSKLTVLLGKAAEKFELLGNEVNRYGTILREVLTKGFSADISSINQKFDEQAKSIRTLNNEQIKLVDTKKEDVKQTKRQTSQAVEFKKAISNVRQQVQSLNEISAKPIVDGQKVNSEVQIVSNGINGLQGHFNRLQNLSNDVSNEMVIDFSNMAIAGAEAFGTALIEGQNVFGALSQIILKTLGDLLIQMGTAAVLASNLAKTFAIPVVGAAAGLAAIAAGAVVKGIAAKMQKNGPRAFAEGGIVSGPTLGLMGEYSGARANPEVVAPLDKLKGMIGNQGGGNVNVTGEFRLQGQDLVVALQRANKQRNRIL